MEIKEVPNYNSLSQFYCDCGDLSDPHCNKYLRNSESRKKIKNDWGSGPHCNNVIVSFPRLTKSPRVHWLYRYASKTLLVLNPILSG